MPAHLLACLLCLPGQADAELEALIAAHEATMAKIKAVAVEYDVYRQRPMEPQKHERHESWAQDATRERKRYAFVETRFSDGTPMGDVCGDYYCDGTDVRVLMNWDEVRKARAAASSGIRAEILPPSAGGHTWFLDSSFVLLQRVGPKAASDSLTVGEYLRRWPSGTKVLPAVEYLGRKLVPVSVDTGGIKSTLYFAPDCGGLVLRQDHDCPAGSGATVPIRTEASAVELETFGEGILLPTRIKYLTTVVGPPQQFIDEATVVSQIAVNDDVPESAFDFRFPAGTVVKRFSATGAEVLEHVWGADNQPIETRSPRPPWWAYPLFAWWSMDSSTFRYITWGLAAFLLVYAATRYLRWRQRRREQSAVTS